jgi:hypothetical protein
MTRGNIEMDEVVMATEADYKPGRIGRAYKLPITMQRMVCSERGREASVLTGAFGCSCVSSRSVPCAVS